MFDGELGYWMDGPSFSAHQSGSTSPGGNIQVNTGYYGQHLLQHFPAERHQQANLRTASPLDNDMTSTADYTLSGNHDRRQHFQQVQLDYHQQHLHQQQDQQQEHQHEGHQQQHQMKKNSTPVPESCRSLSYIKMTSDRIEKLCSQGFTLGLAQALITNASSFEKRIWIVDNSGSMEIDDGQKIIVRDDGRVDIKTGVSRWEELQDTVLYHAEVSATMGSHTCFRLLNDPGRVVGGSRAQVIVGSLGVNGSGHKINVKDEVLNVRRMMMTTRPYGCTPLTEHIRAMEFEIREMLPKLQASGKRIAVILATDGLPSDAQGYGGPEVTQEFIESLRALEGLPVWMVIRLCTDEDDVTEFYNNLDTLLDFSLEVLDDFRGEFQEVTEANPWFNYGLPMHRCRELGYHDRLFDLIDERPLTKGELREFCVLLFGTDFDDIPDPVTDWENFIMYIVEKLQHEKLQWNPIQKKMKPWISVKKLKHIYGPKSTIQRWMKKMHVVKT
jgi:hypothetical protein